MTFHDIENLAPDPVELDDAWSETTLGRIMATPRRRSVRRGWTIAAATAAAVLGGGVAYASNGVPGWVQSSLNSFAGEQGHGDVDLVKIVDFTAPDGNRVVAWRGKSEDGQVCEVLADNFTSEEEALAQSYNCMPAAREALLATHTTVSRPYLMGEREDPATTYPYVYGQFPGVTRVQVIGTGLRSEGRVDGRTGGYHVLLPQPTGYAADVVKFLDAEGEVMRTVDLEVE